MKQIIIAFVILFFSVSLSNAQWVQTNGPVGGGNIAGLAVSGTNIFAGIYGGGVYRSTNNGDSWTAVNNGLTNHNVNLLYVTGSRLYAGTYGGGVFLTTNNGSVWTAMNYGLTDANIYGLVHTPPYFCAGTGKGVFSSMNFGATWTDIGLSNLEITALGVSGTNLFAGSFKTNYPFPPINSVYRGPHNGNNWTEVNNGLTNNSIKCFIVSGIKIFTGTYNGGIFSTTNNGTNWNPVNNGLPDLKVNSLAISGTNLFAGTNGGVFLTTNGGGVWINKNQGFSPPPAVKTMLVANNYVFAGAAGAVWRRSLSEIIGIKNISTEIPSEFSLNQNYPNPFNPTTNIKYSIPKNSFVKLVVFDALGREVETLVNEKQSAGTYEATFGGTSLTSGVYFYRLTTDGFSDTKRMLMIK